MTLSTDVYILDRVDPMEVFRFCQDMLTKYDDPRRLPADQMKVRHEQDTSYTGVPGVWEVQPGNPWSLDNEPMQDLPAWLMTAYRPGEPLRTPEQAAEHDDCEDDCDGDHYYRACWMSVDFDTTYGYRDARGWNCGDLHAALVSELGAWLTSQGVHWEWRNEYTGDVHVGPAGLHELGENGAEARNWFGGVVLPAIIAETAAGGGGRLEIAGVGTFDIPAPTAEGDR